MNELRAFVRRHRQPTELIASLLVTLLVIVWMSGSAYNRSLVLLASLYAFIGLGLYIPFIMGGRLSLAYNAYLGLGAYAVALTATRTGLPMIVGFAIGMIASAMLAVILGLATSKLTAFYLAAVTLFVGQAFSDTLADYPGLVNGEAGVTGIRLPLIFGHQVTQSDIVVFAVLVIWALTASISLLRRSAYGITLRAYREVPIAVDASGVRTTILTISAQAVGAAIASFGGSLYAVANQAIYPDVLTLTIVFFAVFVPFIGGQRTPWGVILGAALITYLTFGLSSLGNWVADSGTLAFSLAVVLVLLVAPNGLLGLFRSNGRRKLRLRSRT